MALPISEKAMNAFAVRAEAQEKGAFLGWWNARRALLGPLAPADVEGAYAAARSAALDLGVTDNAEHRLWLMAAALRLLPKPNPKQELLAYDAVMRHAPDDIRLDELAALREGEG